MVSADLPLTFRRAISADLSEIPLTSAELKNIFENQTADLAPYSADMSAVNFPLTFRRHTADIPLTSADLSADLPTPYGGTLAGARYPVRGKTTPTQEHP